MLVVAYFVKICLIFFNYISLQGHCGSGQQINILHFVFTISLHAVCTSVAFFPNLVKCWLIESFMFVNVYIIGGIYLEWITLSKFKYDNDSASFSALTSQYFVS